MNTINVLMDTSNQLNSDIEDIPLWVQDAMLIYTKAKLDELYLDIAHGDDEHRKWLKDCFEEFKNKLT